MKTKTILLFTLATLAVISVMAQTKKSEVLIISTIHGAHKVNPNYSYDSLFTFIETYNPDIIGVEIRKEDIDSTVLYLKSNYPFEMYECITKYASKKVVGFDWLGDAIAGKAIPENYWKEKSTIKKLQLKLAADSSMQQQLSITNVIQQEKNKLVVSASLTELNDGKYDLMNHIYYEQLKLLLNNTEFKPLADFYKKRDEMIAENILEIIKSNHGKKMIFLVGADHRDYTLKKVFEEFEGTIILNHFK
ncbi:hypothetical protein [Lutibacter maritimus]|uniref:Haem-binding uptake, Tiki superfamily, ChaN n=1 Tax=Lutibacter maritimus TaxID=593133 RepID=A0A1I6Q7K7_9FLAO|nr:hypothetical protein [Lutibacter maritimus]SFS48427.1 hypothetical protein SAMN04488006_1577 [Lutibacter maritimus]